MLNYITCCELQFKCSKLQFKCSKLQFTFQISPLTKYGHYDSLMNYTIECQNTLYTISTTFLPWTVAIP